jgi:TatD DNase family protein
LLVDTHAHLHHEGLYDRLDEVMASAQAAGVTKIVNVGVAEDDSRVAVELAAKYDHVWATVGLHPHDAETDDVTKAISTLKQLATSPGVVAIGECGLDYSREGTSKDKQAMVFRSQIELALEHDLPMVWHVRDAFDDFFQITGEYDGLRGIVHCFTSTKANMQIALERGYYIALNGIMTFTREQAQLDMAKAVPLDRLVLETDCPFLSPVPHRGKTNEPANLKATAEFLAKLRGESYDELAAATSHNAERLLGI